MMKCIGNDIIKSTSSECNGIYNRKSIRSIITYTGTGQCKYSMLKMTPETKII